MQLSVEKFFVGYRHLLERLMREHMHGEVTLVIQDGVIRSVRVNRTYLPAVLVPPGE